MTSTTNTTARTCSNSTSVTDARMVVVRSLRMAMLTAVGRLNLIWGSSLLDPANDLDDVGAGLALDIEDDRWRCAGPRT